MKKQITALAALVALIATGVVVSAPAASAAPLPTYSYQAHVSSVGWQGYVQDGATAGTVGQNKGIEAMRFDFDQHARAHVAGVGWQNYRSGTSIIGTVGESKYMEAIQVRSTLEGVGIKCQAHVQDIGWLPVVNDNEICGTTGKGKRLEALRFWVYENIPDIVLSTVATAGDFNAGPQSAEVLSQMGAIDPDLAFILGDISQSSTSTGPTCALIAEKLADDPFGWVQGNHDVVPDSDGPLTPDWNACLPVTPNSTGTRGVEEVIQIPGARIISASPHLPGSNYDAGSPGLARISAAIDAAKAAGDFPIIAIHRPHYTVGQHGTSGTQSKAISQLAIDKGVKLVLNGHDHNYARLVKDGTTFITVGTGGHGPRPLNAASPYNSLVQKAYGGTPGAYGWLKLDITATKINGTFIGTHGPDSFSLTK